jgi:hypothetical protein
MPRSLRKKTTSEKPAAKRKLDFDAKSPPLEADPSKNDDSAFVGLTAAAASPTKKKRGVDSFFDKKEAALVTPEKRHKVVVDNKKGYVPKYIHKNLEYKRKGETDDPTLVATYQLVEKYFDIPDDFENNRTFGPKSGVSFEERAISAYSLGLLEPRSKESANIQICSACATEGHKRSSCPQLV